MSAKSSIFIIIIIFLEYNSARMLMNEFKYLESSFLEEDYIEYDTPISEGDRLEFENETINPKYNNFNNGFNIDPTIVDNLSDLENVYHNNSFIKNGVTHPYVYIINDINFDNYNVEKENNFNISKVENYSYINETNNIKISDDIKLSNNTSENKIIENYSQNKSRIMYNQSENNDNINNITSSIVNNSIFYKIEKELDNISKSLDEHYEASLILLNNQQEKNKYENIYYRNSSSYNNSINNISFINNRNPNNCFSDILCHECKNNICEKCNIYSFLNNETNKCQCKIGYYKKDKVCVKCNPLCETCSDMNKCNKCIKDAILKDKICECSSLYIFDAYSEKCIPNSIKGEKLCNNILEENSIDCIETNSNEEIKFSYILHNNPLKSPNYIINDKDILGVSWENELIIKDGLNYEYKYGRYIKSKYSEFYKFIKEYNEVCFISPNRLLEYSNTLSLGIFSDKRLYIDNKINHNISTDDINPLNEISHLYNFNQSEFIQISPVYIISNWTDNYGVSNIEICSGMKEIVQKDMDNDFLLKDLINQFNKKEILKKFKLDEYILNYDTMDKITNAYFKNYNIRNKDIIDKVNSETHELFIKFMEYKIHSHLYGDKDNYNLKAILSPILTNVFKKIDHTIKEERRLSERLINEYLKSGKYYTDILEGYTKANIIFTEEEIYWSLIALIKRINGEKITFLSPSSVTFELFKIKQNRTISEFISIHEKSLFVREKEISQSMFKDEDNNEEKEYLDISDYSAKEEFENLFNTNNYILKVYYNQQIIFNKPYNEVRNILSNYIVKVENVKDFCFPRKMSILHKISMILFALIIFQTLVIASLYYLK